MQKQNPGLGLIVGLMGATWTLPAADPHGPAAGTDAAARAERAAFHGAPLPPIRFRPDEMGDFPPVGSPSLPATLELKQE